MQALVTGASSGIGRGLAYLLGRDGYDLVLCARSKQGLEDAAARIRADADVSVQLVTMDLSVPGAADELFSQVSGAVDVLVNSAGVGDFGAFVDADWDKQQSMISLNVTTLTRLSQLCAQQMHERGAGRILNVSSVAGFLPGPYMSVYYASKAYVLSFSQSLAGELSGSGVSVTCLCPGPTDTQFSQAAGAGGTSMFSGDLPSPQEVASYGYKALKKGKRVAVPGWRNKLNVFLTRLLPRSLVLAFMRRIQRP